MRRVKIWTEAMKSHAVAEAVVCSKSLARRRLRPSHAKVRSTTQRLGKTSKPLAWSDRLMISTVHFPILRSA
jgi:putative transposase